MNKKVISQLEQIEMGTLFEKCITYRTFRFLGVNWKKRIEYYFDKSNGDFVILYE